MSFLTEKAVLFLLGGFLLTVWSHFTGLGNVIVAQPCNIHSQGGRRSKRGVHKPWLDVTFLEWLLPSRKKIYKHYSVMPAKKQVTARG